MKFGFVKLLYIILAIELILCTQKLVMDAIIHFTTHSYIALLQMYYEQLIQIAPNILHRKRRVCQSFLGKHAAYLSTLAAKYSKYESCRKVMWLLGKTISFRCIR